MGNAPDPKNRRSPHPSPRSTHPSTLPEGGEERRIDQLARAIDLCSEAKHIADSTGEKFLAYLLAMAIQETRGAMRSQLEARGHDADDLGTDLNSRCNGNLAATQKGQIKK